MSTAKNCPPEELFSTYVYPEPAKDPGGAGGRGERNHSFGSFAGGHRVATSFSSPEDGIAFFFQFPVTFRVRSSLEEGSTEVQALVTKAPCRRGGGREGVEEKVKKRPQRKPKSLEGEERANEVHIVPVVGLLKQ